MPVDYPDSHHQKSETTKSQRENKSDGMDDPTNLPTTATTPSQTLSDEVLSLNAIYGPGTLSHPTPVSADLAAGAEAVFRLPSRPAVALRVFFPDTYADDPPAVLGTHSTTLVGAEADGAKGGGLQRGEGRRVVALAREVLGRVFVPGEPCLYAVAEELGEVLCAELGEGAKAGDETAGTGGNEHEVERLQDGCVAREDGPAGYAQHVDARLVAQPEQVPEWTVGVPITEKKSVFLARCVSVTSVDQAQAFLAHLLATDKRAARATHNISAWRIRGAAPPAAGNAGSNTQDASTVISYQDFDEDGETAAGARVLRLLQLMDVWNVLVVVSRWYGGVLLGPARFAIINESAREVLLAWKENAAFMTAKSGSKSSSKKGKR